MRPSITMAIVSVLVWAPVCPPVNAQTTSSTQPSTTLQSLEQQFIEQLVVAELQTFFQQVDSYAASSLSSSLGGTTTTQTTEDQFGQQLEAALLQTFFAQLNSFISQLPTVLLNSSNLLGQTSQLSTGQ
jgi:hypothetical protein